MVGEFAREMESLSEEAVAERAMLALHKVFPQAEWPIGCLRSTWGSDLVDNPVSY